MRAHGPKEVFPFYLSVVSAMRLHFHSHQILAAGEAGSTWPKDIGSLLLFQAYPRVGQDRSSPVCDFVGSLGPQNQHVHTDGLF